MAVLQVFASYSGRMSRSEFWLKGLVPLYVASMLPVGVLTAVFGFSPETLTQGWLAVLSMAALWFLLPLWIKRLHDRNRSAWFLLISLVPIIGGLWLFVETGFFRGTVGPNRYGVDSLARGAGMQPGAPSGALAFDRKAVGMAILSVLLVLSLGVIAAVGVPACASRFMDFGTSLPGPTRLTISLAGCFYRSGVGVHFGGLLMGLWMWMCLRAVYMVACGREARWPRRWLLSGLAVALLLNLLAGLSLYLPYVKAGMVVAAP